MRGNQRTSGEIIDKFCPRLLQENVKEHLTMRSVTIKEFLADFSTK